MYILIPVGFVVGVIFGMICVDVNWRDESVRKGKAEYYLDTFNVKKWRWLK